MQWIQESELGIPTGPLWASASLSERNTKDTHLPGWGLSEATSVEGLAQGWAVSRPQGRSFSCTWPAFSIDSPLPSLHHVEGGASYFGCHISWMVEGHFLPEILIVGTWKALCQGYPIFANGLPIQNRVCAKLHLLPPPATLQCGGKGSPSDQYVLENASAVLWHLVSNLQTENFPPCPEPTATQCGAHSALWMQWVYIQSIAFG